MKSNFTAAGNTNRESILPETLYSRLAADPVLGELVVLFVEEMPDRIGVLEAQAAARDWGQLGRAAHQLKGAAGSYGFDEITPFAARLEVAARDAGGEEEIRAAFQELVALCRRVRSGMPQAG